MRELLMFADGDVAILTPFLLILIFWLAVVFASYALFVEPSRVVITALLIFCALDFERAVSASQTRVSPLSA